jgi:hypothetical protein
MASTNNVDRTRQDVDHNTDTVTSPPLPFPFNFLVNMISSTIRLIKPLAPHLIPLVVFALAIPVVIALSLSAGWFVWRSIAVGWESPLYLQYGYVQ